MTKLEKFKEASSDFNFEFSDETVKFQHEELKLIKLFKTDEGLNLYIDSNVDFLYMEPDLQIKVRSIPHLIKIINSVYN